VLSVRRLSVGLASATAIAKATGSSWIRTSRLCHLHNHRQTTVQIDPHVVLLMLHRTLPSSFTDWPGHPEWPWTLGPVGERSSVGPRIAVRADSVSRRWAIGSVAKVRMTTPYATLCGARRRIRLNGRLAVEFCTNFLEHLGAFNELGTNSRGRLSQNTVVEW
jgi:hypothetical protein